MKTYMPLPDAFHDFPISREWHAAWIGPPVQEQGVSCYLFRREIQRSAVDSLTLSITAGHEYELFINGTRVTCGPPPSQPYWKYYDDIDVDDLVRPGTNCIGVVVHGTDEPVGLLAELADSNGTILAGTGTDWRVTGHHGWRTGEESSFEHRQEFFDARLHPDGWSLAGFDDSTWSGAEVLFADPSSKRPVPWYRLVPREIPLLEESHIPPQAIVAVEEGQEVLSRGREEWLSVQLSSAGQPISRTKAAGVDTLLSAGAGRACFSCSLDHKESKAFDGVWCPNVVLDFGRVYSGYFEIELEGPAGSIVEIGYVERLLNGHFNNAVEVFYADRYTLRSGCQIFRSAIWKSFRYVKLRFLRCSEPVTVIRVTTVACGYPFKDLGSFKAADATLAGVFDISRHTLRLCARDYLMDSPWREKSQWTGDVSAVTLGGIYACFGDTKLAGKFLRQAMVNQVPQGLIANNFHGFAGPGRSYAGFYHRVIPDYSLWWINALWQHYLYTGDERYLHEGYPVVTQILQFHFHYLNRLGLLSRLPGWIFIDHVFQCRAHELAVYNALFYGALESAGRIAEFKNDRWMAERIGTAREALLSSFHARFFDADTGVYMDGRTEGDAVRSVSEHTNMAALLWDLCPKEHRSGIIDRFYLKKAVDYLEAQPFFTAVVLRALAHCGRMDVALDIVRNRWGRRMLDAGMTSTTEEWNATGSWRGAGNGHVGIFRSLSHAWSACPAEFLTRNLIGLRILKPGCSEVQVVPASTDFDYQVSYPVPQGAIEVQCSNGQSNVTVPPGVRLIV